MLYKVISLLLFLILLFQRAATRHNLAYQATSQVSPGLYTGCFTSTINTATDGFITQYSDFSCAYLDVYLFMTKPSSSIPGNLTISLPIKTTVRIIFILQEKNMPKEFKVSQSVWEILIPQVPRATNQPLAYQAGSLVMAALLALIFSWSILLLLDILPIQVCSSFMN